MQTVRRDWSDLTSTSTILREHKGQTHTSTWYPGTGGLPGATSQENTIVLSQRLCYRQIRDQGIQCYWNLEGSWMEKAMKGNRSCVSFCDPAGLGPKMGNLTSRSFFPATFCSFPRTNPQMGPKDKDALWGHLCGSASQGTELGVNRKKMYPKEADGKQK